ncbi:collagen alpha-1(X) chain-like [Anneissia japonica]|uniref:collagen alpha-1(X) chain-like n=1 Tax=Anneissia japonica TaxID=1529436 RepID=UPI001425A7F8|nr:collagen alpha-1(X) chain-like [Anneissia japonica]
MLRDVPSWQNKSRGLNKVCSQGIPDILVRPYQRDFVGRKFYEEPNRKMFFFLLVFPLLSNIQIYGEEMTTDQPALTTMIPYSTTGSTIQPKKNGTQKVCGSSSNICRRGYDGAQGAQGLPGVQGIQGPRGPPGIEGCRGPPGHIGPHGSPGVPGVDGKAGKTGVVGLKGEKGDPGTCTCEVERTAPASSRQASASYVIPAQTFNTPLSSPFLAASRGSAFSVARITPIMPNTNNTAITFDVVYANLGNDFDMKTGFYKCPLNGTYYFNTHVYKHKILKKPSVRLYKNDEYIMVIDDFAPPNRHDSTSSSVILSLVEGDRVWLELNRKVKLHHNRSRRSIFTGFLLFPANAHP